MRWLRFLVGGCLNTAFTYGVYFALIHFIPYQWAYFFAYGLGVGFAYYFNASHVFKVPLSWKGLFIYPLVYLIQYGVSAGLLGSAVEIFGISKKLAPLLVSIAMIPVTYVLNKWILTRLHTPTRELNDKHF